MGKYYFCSGIENPVHTDEPILGRKPGRLKIEMPIVEVSPELERVLFGERDLKPNDPVIVELNGHRFQTYSHYIHHTTYTDEHGNLRHKYEFTYLKHIGRTED